MAKPKSEVTAAQKAVLALRQKVEVARTAHDKNGNEQNKKALEHAQGELKAAVLVENRERFVRVAGGRVVKARAAIRNLANVAQPRSYSYTEEDCDKAEKALTEEIKKSIGALRSALTKTPGAAKAADDFSF